jgi:hypothetical protein
MKKITLSCLLLLSFLQLTHGQNGLIKINVPAGTTVQSLDAPTKPTDSTELVKGLVESFCDKLSENVRAGTISLSSLSQNGIGSLLAEKNQDALKTLSGTQYVTSFVNIEKGFRIALRA